jgi:hypothetical protein
MWYWLVIISLLLLLWSETRSQPSISGYTAQFFGQSNGKSEAIFNKMKEDDLSSDSIREFLSMEDRFLAYEKQGVCNNVSVITDAKTLSQQIKDRFVGYNFSYHDDHIRQMAMPSRLINRNLVCL